MQGHKSKIGHQSNKFNTQRLTQKYTRGGLRPFRGRKSGHQPAISFSTSVLTFSTLGIGGLMFGLVCPIVKNSAAAETATEVTTSIDDAISISASPTVAIAITPQAGSNVFASGDATVTVNTNGAYGYLLYMGTTGTDGSGSVTSALVHTDNNAVTIPTLTSSASASTFSSNADSTTVNRWGYSLDKSTYEPMVVSDVNITDTTTTGSAALIKSTEEAISGDSTTVTFGVKVDTTQTAGDYSNTVVFTAVTNPEVLTIFSINNMQEMTADVCSNTTTPASSATLFDTDDTYKSDTSYIPQATLTDTRDSKIYTIRKLADGQCWMVQNLAIDPGTTISSDDTDIASDSTYTLPTTSTTNFTRGSNPTDSGDNNNKMHTGTHIDGHVPTITSGSKYSSDFTSTGNWYSWYAATAGTGTASMSSGNAVASICPKGWKLPDGGYSGQFANLYSAYSRSEVSLNAVFPLQLSGYYYRGGLDYPDTLGYWWSSKVIDSSSAWPLVVHTSGILSSNHSSKYIGSSVRCVAAS